MLTSFADVCRLVLANFRACYLFDVINTPFSFRVRMSLFADVLYFNSICHGHLLSISLKWLWMQNQKHTQKAV